MRKQPTRRLLRTPEPRGLSWPTSPFYSLQIEVTKSKQGCRRQIKTELCPSACRISFSRLTEVTATYMTLRQVKDVASLDSTYVLHCTARPFTINVWAGTGAAEKRKRKTRKQRVVFRFDSGGLRQLRQQTVVWDCSFQNELETLTHAVRKTTTRSMVVPTQTKEPTKARKRFGWRTPAQSSPYLPVVVVVVVVGLWVVTVVVVEVVVVSGPMGSERISTILNSFSCCLCACFNSLLLSP